MIVKSNDKIIKKEEEMQHIFKGIATIIIWFLFILGLVLVVLDGIIMPIVGKNTMIDAYFATGLGIASLILSVIAMKIRQTLQ